MRREGRKGGREVGGEEGREEGARRGSRGGRSERGSKREGAESEKDGLPYHLFAFCTRDTYALDPQQPQESWHRCAGI